jgi:hypothetical protein
MGSHELGRQDVSSALFGKTRRAVLTLLFSRPEETFYLREIVRALRGGQGGVQRELRRLMDAGVLARTVRGRTAFYQANRACPVFGELQGLVVKSVGAAEVLKSADIAARHEAARPGQRPPRDRARLRRDTQAWSERMPPELL